MRITSILICLFFLYACGEKTVKKDARVIYLNPDKAQTLVLSDFFNAYKVFSFSGVLYSNLLGIVKCNDRYITHVSNPKSQLYAFDLEGDSLASIGINGRGAGEYLVINRYSVDKDQTIKIINNEKYLEYSSDGKLLQEQTIKNIQDKMGQFIHLIADSIIVSELMGSNEKINLGKAYNDMLKKNYKDLYKLRFCSLKDGRILHSYLPLTETFDYSLCNFSYVKDDTLCYFNEFDNCLYNISADTIIPRYYINRGKYTQWTPIEEYDKNLRYLEIGAITFRETNQYVIGKYRFKAKRYYFIYDKANNKTYNYDKVNDDLLRTEGNHVQTSPSSNFNFWVMGNQFDNEYLHTSLQPSIFAKMVEKIKKEMNEGQWEVYKAKHPALIEAYEKMNDESSDPIIISYRFKD